MVEHFFNKLKSSTTWTLQPGRSVHLQFEMGLNHNIASYSLMGYVQLQIHILTQGQTT